MVTESKIKKLPLPFMSLKTQIRNGMDPGGKYSYAGIGITHLVSNLLVKLK